MQILDGKKAAQAIKDDLRIDVAQRSNEGKKVPHLAAILVGNNGASETYVASKVKSCEEVGFKSTLIRFDADISEHLLLEKIQELNDDPDVDGILVQLPLPKHISDEQVITEGASLKRCWQLVDAPTAERRRQLVELFFLGVEIEAWVGIARDEQSTGE